MQQMQNLMQKWILERENTSNSEKNCLSVPQNNTTSQSSSLVYGLSWFYVDWIASSDYRSKNRVKKTENSDYLQNMQVNICAKT